MKQTIKEHKDVVLAWIAPHAEVTFGDEADSKFDGLFTRHKNILGSIRFLRRFGSYRGIVELCREHHRLLRLTCAVIPQHRDRVTASRGTRATVRFLHLLAKNAKICERNLQNVNLEFNPNTKKVVIRPTDGHHRPKEIFTELVEEAFDLYRKSLGTSNSSEMRKAIVGRLQPIFDGEAVSGAYEAPVSRAIENYLRRFSPQGEKRSCVDANPVKG